MRENKEYINSRIGSILVLEELETHITPNGSRQRVFKCKCDCGNIFDIRLSNLKKMTCCSKCSSKKRRKDITGKRYGKLVVVAMAEDYISPSNNRLARCKCICDCGKEILVNVSDLSTGKTKSCGCIKNTSGLLKDNLELVAKYDFEKNCNLDINKLKARSNKKVWWKCGECGNSWIATIASQNDKVSHGCPYCSGRLVVEGKNDLLSRFPDLVLSSWDFNKNIIQPNKISCKSGNKVWWKCEEGHSWEATVANRVGGSGCPVCNKENVNSFCEQAVYFYVKKWFLDAVNSDQHLGIELDIYIPDIKAAIEYDGEAWHGSKKRIKNDLSKNELCARNGIELIRIREPRLPKIKNCTVILRKDSTTNKTLDFAIIELLNLLGKNDCDIDTQRDTPLILEQFAAKKDGNSIASVHPELIKEWHPTKNGNLTPDKVNKGSRFVVWWKCPIGHEYQMKVSDRTRKVYIDKNGKRHNPQGCPFCNSKRIEIGFNDLESQRPDIALEWHPTKNGDLKPNQITCGSKKMIWWLGRCGHEWQSQPNARCNNKSQCPICYKQRRSPSVLCIETGQVFANAEEAGKIMNIKHHRTIYKCCRGEAKTAAGYHWKYNL